MKYPDFSDALCREIGTEFFYPEEDISIVPIAKKICSNCPVINECLEWGLRHESFGIWGGTVPRTRQMMRRTMGITVQSILSSDYL
jgi:WhiB family redox-sensing transcriptional regulator